jgi:hypothetical protein
MRGKEVVGRSLPQVNTNKAALEPGCVGRALTDPTQFTAHGAIIVALCLVHSAGRFTRRYQETESAAFQYNSCIKLRCRIRCMFAKEA